MNISKKCIKYEKTNLWWLPYFTAKHLPYLPGTHYQYTDAAFYLLSRIVTKLSRQRLDDFLRPMLFDQLGFQEMAWSCCPHGYPMGATGLYIGRRTW